MASPIHYILSKSKVRPRKVGRLPGILTEKLNLDREIGQIRDSLRVIWEKLYTLNVHSFFLKEGRKKKEQEKSLFSWDISETLIVPVVERETEFFINSFKPKFFFSSAWHQNQKSKQCPRAGSHSNPAHLIWARLLFFIKSKNDFRQATFLGISVVNHILGKNLYQTELVTVESGFVPFSSMKPTCLVLHSCESS